MNLDFYKNKKILITGNTGFKGSWLSLLLIKAGAKVYGISKSVPTKPSLYYLCGLNRSVKQAFADLGDQVSVNHMEKIKPDFIFHLAAQPILTGGVKEPRYTFENNISTTLSVLEYLRSAIVPTIALFITSDKCYLNREWHWGYRETDTLGGEEPYGASKAACELVVASYYHTYFKNSKNIRLATARAGNVIGGGDFTEDRIIPDCIRAWQKGKPIELRNKDGVRPWQHVLEPLGGYLHLCEKMSSYPSLNGESWNFGPAESAFHDVHAVVEELASHFSFHLPGSLFVEDKHKKAHEATLLKISSEKAMSVLKWKPRLDFRESISLTAKWYSAYLSNPSRIKEATLRQIEEYLQLKI